jgi:hypothetical protein
VSWGSAAPRRPAACATARRPRHWSAAPWQPWAPFPRPGRSFSTTATPRRRPTPFGTPCSWFRCGPWRRKNWRSGGVLLEAISSLYGERAGAITSCVLFGLWHIPSSLDFGTDNLGITSHVHGARRAQILGVVGTVLGTAAADVLFVQLRRRSGSLLAPAGLHWAFNGAAVLVSAAAWRRVDR